jgi:hypothetical protein
VVVVVVGIISGSSSSGSGSGSGISGEVLISVGSSSTGSSK